MSSSVVVRRKINQLVFMCIDNDISIDIKKKYEKRRSPRLYPLLNITGYFISGFPARILSRIFLSICDNNKVIYSGTPSCRNCE